ncbi:MAG TPA: selenocysteine-specific translation elongation factor [Pirellulales bacterium]|nr:selenocysteine-specific translation elongation factor [Pirellulales bacterium]
MTTDLILGTAGHIDHGKTALVKALTGVDTDRLPEEKLRGITIELGFAQLALGDCRLGIVDVPGHERFVRNMLAGATGVDLALLVVAADDSVKPQTREHLDILRLLDLDAGVIAITKCDLPDADWLDLVEEEIRELVRGTFLESAPIVRTSVVTGQGLDDLRAALLAAAQQAAHSLRRRALAGPFRMAIDRSFTIAGHGTVVTGSVASGRAKVGDELSLEPGGVRVRVRGLQNHDAPAEEVHRGQRAAINLAGVHHDEIRRGQELAAPGHLVPSRLLSVQLKLLESAERPLKHRSRVRCHLGTAELMASVVLIDRERLAPGETAAAQLFLSEPAVAVWGQPLVIRSESPLETIGGGRVLDPKAPKLARRQGEALARLAELAADDPLARASAAIYFFGLGEWTPADLSRSAGADDPEAAVAELLRRGDLQELRLSAGRTLLVHRLFLEELFGRVESLLEKEHQRFPLRTMLDRSPLAARLAYLGSDALVDAVLEAMRRAGRLKATERGIALPGRGPQLSNSEQRLFAQIIEGYRAAGFQAPTVDEVRAQTPKNQQAVPQLVALAAAEGQLIEAAPGFYLHADSERRLRHTLGERLALGAGLTVSEIREILGVSRKYAVPLCEYLDRIGFTRREGDLRVRAGEGVRSEE